MKNLLFIVAALAFLSSCQNEREGELDLNFKALYGNDALVLNEAYSLDSIDVKFENLTFLLTDISVINSKDETIELSDAEFVELNGFDEASANAGHVLNFKSIPSGSYKMIRFTIGVTEDLNKMTPGDFQVDEPLGRSDHYWEAWGSYIFSKTEGNADVNKNGVFDLKFFYHTGGDVLRRTFEIETDIEMEGDATSTIELFLDYNELLRNADRTAFDIEASPRNHDPNKLEIITQYVDNYPRAIKIRQ